VVSRQPGSGQAHEGGKLLGFVAAALGANDERREGGLECVGGVVARHKVTSAYWHCWCLHGILLDSRLLHTRLEHGMLVYLLLPSLPELAEFDRRGI